MPRRGLFMCQPCRGGYVSNEEFDYPNEFEYFGSSRKPNRHRRDKGEVVLKGVKLTVSTFQGKSDLDT